MKKDIYIIKNKINNLVYIGQAANSAVRWSGHKSSARHSVKKIIIDQAMHDLGIENFWYEIIETVENYDEREEYWIGYYNSVFPNGYNKLTGGDGARPGVKSANATIRDQEIIDSIIYDLIFTDTKLVDIAGKYDTTLKLVSAINRGQSYVDSNKKYPLRVRDIDKIEELNFEGVINDLIYTDISYRKLAEKYNTSDYIIRQINKGSKFFNEKYHYPLRKKKDDKKYQQIRELLKNSDLTMKEIGEICGVSSSMVVQINAGKYHFVASENYPIREQRKKNRCS